MVCRYERSPGRSFTGSGGASTVEGLILASGLGFVWSIVGDNWNLSNLFDFVRRIAYRCSISILGFDRFRRVYAGTII